MYFRYLILLCILYYAYASVVRPYNTYKNYKLYQVSGEKNRLDQVISDLKENYKNDVIALDEDDSTKPHLLLSPDVVHLFEEMAEAKQLNIKTIVEDYSELLLSETVSPRGNEFSWTAYHDVDDIYTYLQNVSKAFPNSNSVIVGGQSYEGRQILGLRINTHYGEDKPVMFIESGIHAREWIAPATTTYFINQLLTSEDPEIRAMRDEFDWRIFPTVNPDGYHYTFIEDRWWRKTRSLSSCGCYGADPNRNWDYNWMTYSSSSDPCNNSSYAGSRPFSEVETRTLSKYISGIKNLTAYIAFHSVAQILLLPYSDSTDHIDNYDDLVQIGNASFEYGKAVTGESYKKIGTAAEILYKASGGSMDWVRHTFGTPLVFAYELRGYHFHWPAAKIHEQGDEVTQMLLGLVTEAKALGYF